MIIINAGDAVSMDDDFCNWLEEIGIRPDVTWRVVIYPATQEIEVHQYKLNEKGSKYINTEEEPVGEAAKKEPFVIKYETPPPDHVIPQPRFAGHFSSGGPIGKKV